MRSRPLAAAWPLLALCVLLTSTTVTDAAPEGQVTYAFHVTLAPRWLDPGETESAITSFKVLYAIHDALVKPMPTGQTTPSLAESWAMAPDARVEEPALTLIPAYPYSAPYEEVRLKRQ